MAYSECDMQTASQSTGKGTSLGPSPGHNSLILVCGGTRDTCHAGLAEPWCSWPVGCGAGLDSAGCPRVGNRRRWANGAGAASQSVPQRRPEDASGTRIRSCRGRTPFPRIPTSYRRTRTQAGANGQVLAASRQAYRPPARGLLDAGGAPAIVRTVEPFDERLLLPGITRGNPAASGSE